MCVLGLLYSLTLSPSEGGRDVILVDVSRITRGTSPSASPLLKYCHNLAACWLATTQPHLNSILFLPSLRISMSSTTTTSNAATPGSLVVRPVKPVRNLFYVFELCANCGFVYFEDAIYARNFRKDNAFYIRVERRFSSEQSYHDDMHKNESMIACFPGSQCLESTSFQRGFSRITQKPFAPVPQPPHCPSPEIRAQVSSEQRK